MSVPGGSSLHPEQTLPQQLTSFIGREREVAEVKRLLGSVRLLTLTGPGGVGKTRLALQVAYDLLLSTEFADGVYFVNLAPIDNPNLVVHTIVTALGVKEVSGQPLLDGLKTYLRDKQVLLVLDNCEHVVEACAHLADALLRSCAELHILATSRQSLGLIGEMVWQVPPLSLPDIIRLPPVELLGRYEAVELFLERARYARADFELDPHNAPAIAEMCHRLDGLPLAIELAAARVKILPPRAMLDKLNSRLKLLTGGTRDMPQRQQTLRAAIEWSHDLLNTEEQKLFRRLAVFQGGRTLDAIEAVCGSPVEGLVPLELDVLDGVWQLVDKSLLRQREGKSGEPRFFMLETIHEYAREKLAEAAGEEEVLRRQHALYFLELTERAEPLLKEAQQLQWLARLEEEQDNLRTALSWSLQDPGRAETALRLGSALGWFWRLRGIFAEGRNWLESALKISESAQRALPGTLRARALFWAAWLAYLEGDFTQARAIFEQSLAVGRAEGDKVGTALSLFRLGWIYILAGDLPAARSMEEEALALFREASDKWGVAYTLFSLGWLMMKSGDYAQAQALAEESLAVARQVGDRLTLGYALRGLGNVVMANGDYARARALFEESLAKWKELDDRSGIADVYNALGELGRLQEDWPAVMALHEESLALFRDIGDKYGTQLVLQNMGYVALRQGDYKRACVLFAECLVLLREQGSDDKQNISLCLAGLASAAWKLGERKGAGVLMGAAEALQEGLGLALDPADKVEYERLVAESRARMGDAIWKVAWQEGRAMAQGDGATERVVAYALEVAPRLEEGVPALQDVSIARGVAKQPSTVYPNDLTRREVEVLRLLAEGLSNEQIAERLFLSTHTIRAHLYSIYGKLGVNTRGAAVRFAVDNGLVE